jgi:hypothetical protein
MAAVVTTKRLAKVVLVLLSGMIADGVFYSAHAQCADGDKIYIDPRLVPKRPQPSRDAMARVLADHDMEPRIKELIVKQYMQKDHPIELPYGTGKVLVHPTNPCIQQYIP